MVECSIESYICTKTTEVNVSAFVYKLFHKDFSPIIGTNFVETQLFLCLTYNNVVGVLVLVLVLVLTLIISYLSWD